MYSLVNDEMNGSKIVEVQNRIDGHTSIIINRVMTKKSESKIRMTMMMIREKIKLK